MQFLVEPPYLPLLLASLVDFARFGPKKGVYYTKLKINFSPVEEVHFWPAFSPIFSYENVSAKMYLFETKRVQ